MPAKADFRNWPPFLTLQSVVDFTVSAQAVVNAPYLDFPANGSLLRPLRAASEDAKELERRGIQASCFAMSALHNATDGKPRMTRKCEQSEFLQLRKFIEIPTHCREASQGFCVVVKDEKFEKSGGQPRENASVFSSAALII